MCSGPRYFPPSSPPAAWKWQGPARAAVLARGRSISLRERLEEALAVLFADPDPGIPDREAHVQRHARSPAPASPPRSLRPFSVNLMALPRRFTITCRRRPGSPWTAVGISSSDVTDQFQILFVRLSAPACPPIPQPRPGGQSRCSSRVSFPASILEKSRMSLMIESSASPGRPDDLGVLALFRGEPGIQQEPRHADDAVHRGPDLMAHVRDEFRLQPGGLQRLPRGPRRVRAPVLQASASAPRPWIWP